MKHNHIINLLWISIPICALLRLLQILFTIDGTTGFINQQYSDIGTLISLIIFAAVAAMGVMAYFAEGPSKPEPALRPILAFTCTLTGGMFIFATVSGISTFNSWHSILLVLLSLMSAFVFILFGLKNIYSYNFSPILLIVPTLYYIVKLINLFLTTSAIALVSENIFLLFTNSAVLWFLFEFAQYENNFGDPKKTYKKIFASGICAVMLCIITGLPKLILIILQEGTVLRGDVSSALLMLSQAVFILSYLVGIFGQNKINYQKAASKHSA